MIVAICGPVSLRVSMRDQAQAIVIIREALEWATRAGPGNEA
jgi:hypothetical protein